MILYDSLIRIVTKGRILNAIDHPNYRKRTINEMNLPSDLEIYQALLSDPSAIRIMNKNKFFGHGDLIGVRLSLNVSRKTGYKILALHKGTNLSGYKNNSGFYRGEVRQYKQVVTLKNAYFNVNQSGRDSIASGRKSKFPMASVDGEYQEVEPNFCGVEVKFDPKETHLFVTVDGKAIKRADEVTVCGNKMYVRGELEFYCEQNAPRKVGDSFSNVRFVDS